MPWASAHAKPTPLESPRRFESLCFAGVLGPLPRLTAEVQSLADKSFALLRSNARHPPLQLKRVSEYSSVRVGLHYRALGIDVKDGVCWFWIGTHADYDKIIG
jgi:hypothetical protein